MAFEQGPIRPPSEAESLLLRLTRNCPWNRCTFCPVYKGKKFSKRTQEAILADIDEVAEGVERAKEFSWRAGDGGKITRSVATAILNDHDTPPAAAAAVVWLYYGNGSVFLQDSDALVLPDRTLVKILTHLRKTLPGISRVTCYSRSATLSRKKVESLNEIKQAGLDRVHVGMESGSRKVLDLIRKGATPTMHIKGGVAALEAGLELSEYVMPGLGGRSLSREHAVESAGVITEISPHFTRLRSLGIRRGTPIREMVQKKEFTPPGDDMIIREIKTFVENLKDAKTMLVSDHILNLLGDLEGKLPEQHSMLLKIIDRYLELPQREKDIYRLGRRSGFFGSSGDLEKPELYRMAENIYEEAMETESSVDEICSRLIAQMI